jgi:hypothetical protein
VSFTGERLVMGRLVEPASEGWLVRLDDGTVVLAQVGRTENLYGFVVGERACVSLCPGQAPELTGYLT